MRRRLETVGERPDIYHANFLGAFDAIGSGKTSLVFAPIATHRQGGAVREGLLRDAQELERGCLTFEDVVDLDETVGLAFTPFAGVTLSRVLQRAPVELGEAVLFGLAACEALMADRRYHPDFNLVVTEDGAWARVPELKHARDLERQQLTAESLRWASIDEYDAAFFLGHLIQQLVTGRRPGSVPFLRPEQLSQVTRSDCAEPSQSMAGPLLRLVRAGLRPRDARASLSEIHAELVLMR